jgi:hypothetical protein
MSTIAYIFDPPVAFPSALGGPPMEFRADSNGISDSSQGSPPVTQPTDD